MMGATITQIKVGWDPPAEMNGTLKGYYVFLGKSHNNQIVKGFSLDLSLKNFNKITFKKLDNACKYDILSFNIH